MSDYIAIINKNSGESDAAFVARVNVILQKRREQGIIVTSKDIKEGAQGKYCVYEYDTSPQKLLLG